MNSALHVASHNVGVWSLTLPGGALVFCALLFTVSTWENQNATALSAFLLASAWLVRGVFQGAAAHYVQEWLLGQNEASVRNSLKIASSRLPLLISTASLVVTLQALLAVITLGVGLLFTGPLGCSYALIVQGKTSPLSIVKTAYSATGPSKSAAFMLNLLFGVQWVVFLQVHLVAQTVFFILEKFLNVDLVFLNELASLKNPPWVMMVVGVTFILFEPLRAILGALLPIDARVRREGLDLLASLDKLPSKRRHQAEVASSILLTVFLGVLMLSSSKVWAQEDAHSRLQMLVANCGLENPGMAEKLQQLQELPAEDTPALEAFVTEIEWLTEEDCEFALNRLQSALPYVLEYKASTQPSGADTAKKRAQDILNRPEFSANAAPETARKDADGWWEQLWKKIKEWLDSLDERERERQVTVPGGSGGFDLASSLAWGLGILASALVIGLIVNYVARSRHKYASLGHVEITSLSNAQEENALSRSVASWAALADELAASGNFREAIRNLYLALLGKLHRQGAIDYDPTLSNWEYISAFHGASESLHCFRQLTFQFDYFWYGEFPTTLENYSAFRDLAQLILADASPSRVEHAR